MSDIEDEDYIAAQLNEHLEMLESLIQTNSAAFLTTVDQTLRSSRTVQFVREGVANEDIDPASALLGIIATKEVLWAMVLEQLSKSGSLSDARHRWAESVVGPRANQEDFVEALGTNLTTFKRFLRERRRREGVPAKRGRPKKSEK